ncbi:MAG: tRNA (N6-isopentenyl adenosine(37)-C2)-methylthiotransferase MiaB [Muribaculaceae bacterium]|nr:tRNA (N6-isopentenyl adenosine(37)-C2)-methylthiotransferase MiaB [Roseburia sp.]MCM1430419.1 tRNA (N6-isopentenyl adenosine(37)-C2)-methylthiotransferase MiaB [Muribaculaceae bacterium]MCM1492385.1 tRNA (N6-isopentenyl adenosine(37)-C2)-methylthiotransferase MiaB [Muribaculaceae bacterium]
MYNEVDLDQIDLQAKPPAEEPARQYYYMAKCREWINAYKQKNGSAPNACVTTFGCQMNARDSEKLSGILSDVGYLLTEDENADFVIYNTCTVRENANNKVYGRLGTLLGYKRKNKNMRIALCGCMMQERGVVEKLKSSYPFVNLVFGTHNIYKFAELLYRSLESEQMIVDIWEEQDRIVEELPVQRKYPFKSGVNIMFGCNNFCSYCIVPYVRGRERSREPGDIIREIRALAEDGVCEVMLLGQNVNSYGKGLEPAVSFADLLREVNEISGIKRIRFMTSHPKDLSEELILAMKECGKVCRHLHLPLQSGSSRILKQMNRRYDKEQYLSLVERIRTAVPDIALTTDIIVGFPGETEEDFLETMDVVKRVEFDSAFTFLYSKRTGTPAASMENQVDISTAKARFNVLLKEVQAISAKKAMALEGKTGEVLVEEQNAQDGRLVTGRLSNNSIVHFPGDVSMIGTIKKVRLVECKGFYYLGEPVDG